MAWRPGVGNIAKYTEGKLKQKIQTYSTDDQTTFSGSTVLATDTAIFSNAASIVTSGSISGSAGATFLGTVIANSLQISGNVGFGTSPSTNLHVAGDDARIRIDGDANSHPGLELSEAGTRKWIIYNNYANDNLTWKTNADIRMTLTQAGVFSVLNEISSSNTVSGHALAVQAGATLTGSLVNHGSVTITNGTLSSSSPMVIGGAAVISNTLDVSGNLKTSGDLTVAGDDIKDSGNQTVLSFNGDGTIDNSVSFANSQGILVNNYLKSYGDTNTYINFSTADKIGFQVGDINMANFTETTQNIIDFNPGGGDVDFKVRGNSIEKLLFLEASSDQIQFGGTLSSSASPAVVGGTVTLTNAASLVTSGSVALAGTLSSSAAAVIGGTVTLTNGTSLVTSGNVGIGTGSPDYELDVAGDIGVNEYIYHNGDSNTYIRFTDDDINITVGGVNMLDFTEGASDSIVFNEAGADLDFRVESNGQANMFVIVGGDDRIGIGTGSPMNRLQIDHAGADGDDGLMIVRADTSTAEDNLLGGIGFDSTDGNVPSTITEASAYIAGYASEAHGTGDKGGYIVFGTSLTNDNDDTTSHERVRVSNSGHVGIAKTAPNSPLHIYSTLNLNADSNFSNNRAVVRIEDASNSMLIDSNQIERSGNGTLYVQYNSGGNFDAVVGGGAARKPSGGSWTATSDRRVKKDIIEFVDGLEVLTQLNPIKYKYNGKGGLRDNGKEYIGMVAQDVEAHAPYMVWQEKELMNPDDTEETDIYQFDPSALVYICLNAIKELKQRIEELEGSS